MNETIPPSEIYSPSQPVRKLGPVYNKTKLKPPGDKSPNRLGISDVEKIENEIHQIRGRVSELDKYLGSLQRYIVSIKSHTSTSSGISDISIPPVTHMYLEELYHRIKKHYICKFSSCKFPDSRCNKLHYYARKTEFVHDLWGIMNNGSMCMDSGISIVITNAIDSRFNSAKTAWTVKDLINKSVLNKGR